MTEAQVPHNLLGEAAFYLFCYTGQPWLHVGGDCTAGGAHGAIL